MSNNLFRRPLGVPYRAEHAEPAQCRAVVDTCLRAAHRPGARLVPLPSGRGRAGVQLEGHRDEPDHGVGQSAVRCGVEDPDRGDLLGALRADAAATAGERGRAVVVGAADAARPGLLLLLVAPWAPRHPDPVGLSRRAPLQQELQPLHRAASALDERDHLGLLRADDPGRRAPRGAGVLLLGQPGVPVLDPHRADRPAAGLGGVRLQHALPPPGSPRVARRLPGPQLRRDPDRLGPDVRLLHRRDRPPCLRADQESRHLQPLRVATHEYAAIARDLAAADNWRDRVRHLVKGPGWQPGPSTSPEGTPAC